MAAAGGRRRCSPRTYLLSNLFRDQLDRYGELELLADRWAELVERHAGGARFVLNADDPLVADLGRGREGVVYFGVSDDSQALPELQHAADSKHCRNCGAPYVYDAVLPRPPRPLPLPQLRARAARSPSVVAERVQLDGMRGADVTLSTPAGSAGPAPARSRASTTSTTRSAAAALALELGAPLDTVRSALEGFGGAFGRVETIAVDGRPVSILLVKNPAGANEVLRTLTLEDGELDLWLALNDKIADGRDVSWIWDADFELLAGRVRRVTCSGTRAEEMALRLKYAGDRGRARRWTATWRARSTPRWPPGARTAGRCTPCPPTPRCWSCATCWPARASPRGGPMSDHVFGYGSLVLDGAAGAVETLPGHRRVLGRRDRQPPRRSPATRCTCCDRTARGPTCTWRSSDIEPDPASSVRGLVRAVSEQELEQLDRRERNYDRVDVTDLIDGDFGGRVWTYRGSPEGRERLRAGARGGPRGGLARLPGEGPRRPANPGRGRARAVHRRSPTCRVWDLERVDL